MKRHPQKEDKKPNKTAFIKVRCTAEEKEQICSRATNAGRKYSDYCREMLLSGSVIAVPPIGDNERERPSPSSVRRRCSTHTSPT